MFDTAHGSCHVHRFYRGPNPKPGVHFGGEISTRAFWDCRQDIKKNWGKYKKFYLQNLLFK